MGTTVDKFEAAFETKDLIKSGINRLGGSLTSESTFRSYATELENLYDEMPKVTGEGSNLSLTPTRKGGLTIIPKGACEQDSYSGKNKYDVGTLQTKTEGDITFTPVYKNGLLQYININGTATANVFYQLKKITLSAGNYIMSGGNTNSALCINFGAGRISQYTEEASFTLSNEVTATESFIRIGNGAVVTNEKVYPMIRLASVSDNTYEPYTNGPSPNPDYPQDIRVVTGDNSVVVCNKNLLNRTTCTENALLKWADGEEISGTKSITSDYIRTQVGDNIAMTYKAQILFYDKNKSYLGALQYSGTTIAKTSGDVRNKFITPNYSDIYYVRLGFRSSSNDNLDLTQQDIQVEYGTTPPTTYIAHEEQTYTLHLGTEYLAGISTYKDEIIGKTDDWKIKRYVGKKYTFASGAVDGNVYYWSETNRATTESTNQVAFANKLFFNGNYQNLTNAKAYMQKYQQYLYGIIVAVIVFIVQQVITMIH